MRCCSKCNNIGNKDNDKGGKTRSFAVYIPMDAAEGEVSRIKRKGGGNTKKSGTGERNGKEIDNPKKKLKILSWILSSVIHFVCV